ncbi:MAG: DUF2975 domain-containing protein [Dysgonamonadaceae bacterium]|nr:DUF2975 domain-containing protein [Dysgonamonadaceae bacterium]
MSKKLYVYCICLAIIYVVSLGHGIYEMLDAGIGGFKLAQREFGDANVTVSPYQVLGLHLQPNDGIATFPSTILNEKTGENMRLEIRESLLFLTQLPESIPLYVKVLKIIYLLLTFAFSAIFIYLPFIIYRIIKSVSKEQFYHKKNINNLKKVGIISLFGFVIKVITGFIMNMEAAFYVQVEGYKIAFREYNYSFLFIGLVILVLSEIISYTTGMKEEVDLTV